MNNVLHAGARFKRKRNRAREGAGKSEFSWIKHNLLAKVVGGQVGAYRRLHPQHGMLLIDGNAGDGEGVPKMQGDLFDGVVLSQCTPLLLTESARHIGNADICLCDRDKKKRTLLRQQFPNATVVANHCDIASVIRDHHRYALWLSDPNGYADHGVSQMAEIARRVLCDFVVVLNIGALDRALNTKATGATGAGRACATMRDRYAGMDEPLWWLDRLNKRFLARSRLINQSPNFRYHVMVISNFLSDAARRDPFIDIFERNKA
jgi:hypothetical protein